MDRIIKNVIGGEPFHTEITFCLFALIVTFHWGFGVIG